MSGTATVDCNQAASPACKVGTVQADQVIHSENTVMNAISCLLFFYWGLNNQIKEQLITNIMSNIIPAHRRLSQLSGKLKGVWFIGKILSLSFNTGSFAMWLLHRNTSLVLVSEVILAEVN